MKQNWKKIMTAVLAASMLLSMCSVGAAAEEPPAMPGETGQTMPDGMGEGGTIPDGMGGGTTGETPPDGFGGGSGGGGGSAPAVPPGGGGSQSYTEGGAATDLESKTYTDVTFPVCTEDNAAGVRGGEGVQAVLDNCTVEKTAGDLSGDDASFYGTNSGVHTYKDAQLTIQNSSIHTSATGANGVFAYGDSVITISDTIVDTDGGASGGIMVAGGGTLYATNCAVTTEGQSSAAIRSDRGGGLMVVNGGSYISNGTLGTGSPAVYCVADITVSNATLVAKNAQAFCFEGRNPGKVYNCYLEGNYTATDDDEASNVMVYQSMSGDSDEGTSYFTMVGGVMKAVNSKNLENYRMFYTTNTYCYISLYDVEMIYPETYKGFLLCACNSNQRGWGTAGANGSECVLYCMDQELMGDIEFDTWSYLDCYFTDGSEATTAFIQREDNGDRGCSVYLDDTSKIILTDNSTVQNLYTGGGTIVDENGKTVSILGEDGTVYVKGDSDLSITVTKTYSTENKSAQSNVTSIGTATEYVFDPEALAEEYVDASYIPTDEDGNQYTEAHSFAAETPDTPDAPSVPDKPETPDTPSVPDKPETPDTPSVPDEPNEPDTTEPPAAEITFPDVKEDDWFAPAVTAAVKAGIIQGRETGNFAPQDNVTRAEAATMMVRANQIEVPTVTESGFADVESSHWAVSYIAAAAQNGYMKGQGDGKFAPEASMTRAELAALICQTLGLTSAENAKNFGDVSSDAWYADVVAKASAAGYVQGDDQGNYRPNDPVTRAEFAQVIANIYLTK